MRTFVCLSLFLCACASPDRVHDPAPSSFSGRVLDQDTLQPIEGTYVMASYAERIAGPDGNATRCVKTLGMHTASDGEYRFPIDRPDGLSPATIAAIKYGYRRGGVMQVDKGHGDLLLARQDRNIPAFLYGYGGEAFCIEAATTAQAAAGRRFLEIQRDEMAEYGAEGAQVRGIDVMIVLLKGIDARNEQAGKAVEDSRRFR